MQDSKKNACENENYIFEQPAKGVTTESMGLVNSGQLVKRIFEGASPFAFVREFVQNSIESGATRIDVGPDWTAVKTASDMGTPLSYKLMFSDNGEGIARSKMKTLLNNLSSSGKTMGSDANFGIGAKVSSLPWNSYGIVFMSWTKDDEGMVRLFRKTDGNYGLFRWNESDDEHERFNDLTVPPNAYRETWQKPSGTSVVLLGANETEDTLLGPPNEKAGLHAVLHVLNDRYFQFPEGVKVSVCTFQNGTKSQWPKTKSDARRFYREAKGTKWYLDRASDKSGTINTKDAKLHWWWHPSAEPNQFQGLSTPGFVGALYDNELYDVTRKSRTQMYSIMGAFARFGLFFEDVWKNVTIIVEPKKGTEEFPGVTPDLSRARLRSANGGELPWDEWGKAFVDHMPEVIAAAVDKASEGTESQVNLESKLKEFFDRMDLYFQEKKESNSNSESSVPRRRSSRNTNPSPNHGDGEFKPTKYNIPVRQWVKPSDLSSDGDLFQGKAVHYQESANTVLFNEEFPLWKQMQEYWVSQWPTTTPGLRKMVQTAVRTVYEQAVVTRIVHVRRFKGKSDWNSASVDRALSNEALTVAVLGIQDADTHISAYLKGTVKMKRANSKAHAHGSKTVSQSYSWPNMPGFPGSVGV